MFHFHFSGVFNGKDIARLMKSVAFTEVLTYEERRGWIFVKEVITRLLGKKRSGAYGPFLEGMMRSFEQLNVHMSLKIHYLHCHIEYFLQQMSTESDEHGERFHQIAAVMEARYKGKKLDALLGDLCWWLNKSFDDKDEDIEFSDIEEIVDSSDTDAGEDEVEVEAMSTNENEAMTVEDDTPGSVDDRDEYDEDEYDDDDDDQGSMELGQSGLPAKRRRLTVDF